jgi:hypothetical protein
MSVTLYDATVLSFLQTLGGVAGFMEKARTHFEGQGIDTKDIVAARLFPDMLPFAFQVVSIAHHSRGAIEGVKAGVFSPGAAFDHYDYAGLQGLITDAQTFLKALPRDDVNALGAKDVAFQFRDTRMPFVGADFLLSFSMPNFYFHAATAYDILRMKGAPLGKRDFMGMPRMKQG